MELSNHQNPGQEGTFHVKITKWRPALKVTADGKGLAIHAGSRLLAEMADRSGLTDALSEALAPMCKNRRPDPTRTTEPGSATRNFHPTLLDAHSDKEQAAPTYKKGYGFFPLGTWLDNTSEALAGILRPGNAGANTAADHIEVLERALA